MRFFTPKILVPCCVGIFFLAILLGGSSCKKERLLESGGELRFSTDTVMFDTVFTALGSATIGVKIFNPQDQKVVLSSVRVDGGSTSFFHVNVDGRLGNAVNEVEIAANDSVYVFATVKVDPTNANTPFIIEDKLTATLNGKDFSIPMIAFGQNAHFIKDSVLAGNQIWLTDKPYVIFGYCVVDSARTLTIPAGCHIYMHANARLFVDGTLKAIGTKKDSIIFQGDRLDRAYFGYEGYPGEWGGLFFTSHSNGSVLEHVILRNGGNGAQGFPAALIEVAPDSVNNPMSRQLTLNKVIIENSIGYGLLSFGGTIMATNCLIHSCGANALALVQGGKYNFDYCTIATYGSTKIAHNDNPAAIILNYYNPSPNVLIPGTLKATLRNCVVSGSLQGEFVTDTIQVNSPYESAAIKLENCVLKIDQTKPPWLGQQPTDVVFVNAGQQADSLFRNYAKADFHPSSTSVLIDMGQLISAIGFDLEEEMRPKGNATDIGCYELR